MDIGLKLIEVKEKLPHGSFLPWLEQEFKWSRSAANKFMVVAEVFADKCVNFTHFDTSALYLLSAPSTPEPAREDAIGRAEATMDAAEIKVRAERRCGELLAEMPNHPPGPSKKDTSHNGMYPPALSDLGLTLNDSSRWQRP